MLTYIQVRPLTIHSLAQTSMLLCCVLALAGCGGGDSEVPVNIPNTLITTSEKLNDTGISQCTSGEKRILTDCGAASLGDWFGLNQDGDVGRDFLAVNGQLTKVGAGYLGFDFTKISATGKKLPINATEWSCVLDNHTGLMWEVKTDDGGLHDKYNSYKWYNPDTSTNGGTVGYENNGKNTQAFSKAVNAQALCGYTDWRLPQKQELHSILIYGEYNSGIDTAYFPNIQSVLYYWSSSPVARKGSDSVWVIPFQSRSEGGGDSVSNKRSDGYVLLVRSGG